MMGSTVLRSSYGSRQRADLPERIEHSAGAGEVAGARNAAGSRLDRCDARAMGGEAHAPTRVAAQAERRSSCRDDGGFAAAASARRQRQVIRVIRPAINKVVALPRPAEFGAVRLAEQNAPGRAQAFHDGGVFLGT